MVTLYIPGRGVLRVVLLPAVAAAAAAVLAATAAAVAARGRRGRHDHLGRVRLVVGPVQEQRHREVRRVDLELLVLEDLDKNG